MVHLAEGLLQLPLALPPAVLLQTVHRPGERHQERLKRQGTQHHIDTLAALLLFGIFAACVLTVLLAGAEAYRRVTERDREAYD